MASVFVYHVVGDLTVGKPEVSEFLDTETVESAIKAIAESSEAGIPIWKRVSQKSNQSPVNVIENAQSRQQRFVGILNALDIVVFLATTQQDDSKALSTPVSKIVLHNSSALKVVDPATRLIDALEMMKQGAKRLLVPKSLVWRGMSKRFSILYNLKWLKNSDPSSNNTSNPTNLNRSSSSSATPTSSIQDKFCCLSREDVLRFLIGCLGALAPLPLSSISSLGAINPNYSYIESSSPAIEAAKKLPLDPCAVAVVETTPNGQHKIIGEISSTNLWKCNYLSVAWALANLTAGEFVEDNMGSTRSIPDDTAINDIVGESTNAAKTGYGSSNRPKIFSSRSMGFFSHSSSSISMSMYRGRRRSTPLTCRVTSSLAAVMAQMLSHRATHVWVTEDDDTLVGILGYTDILSAVTRQSVTNVPETTGS